MNQHIPVMTNEVIAGLAIKPNGIYIDGTFGCGGHTQAILRHLNQEGIVVVIDKDPIAIQRARELQQQDQRIKIYHGSYANILAFCQQEQIVNKVNGVVLDLGIASPQIDNAERGFSFMTDGPLDMRMDPTTGLSAAEWLQHAKVADIAFVLKTYGEERYAKKIAQAIVALQQRQPITTTKQLANVIEHIYPRKHLLTKHPATRCFQAIRIFINNELTDLQQALPAIVAVLASKGRLVVLSFHSLEDRIVKHFINDQIIDQRFPSKLPIMAAELQPKLHKIGKAQQPKNDEIMHNVRARSAVLRVAEKAS